MILGWLLLAAIQVGAQEAKKGNVVTYKTYTSFPAFQLLNLDSTKFNSISLMTKKEPSVVMYFSPTCSHCQHQAEEITSHIKDLKNVKILMVSAYPLTEIRQFAETYAIDKFPNITLAFDPNSSLVSFYEIKSLP
eukprot:gene57555-78856_t